MELDVKALGFLARALEYQIGWYEEQMQRPDLTEDEYSDLTNDRYYLQSLLESIEQERDRPFPR